MPVSTRRLVRGQALGKEIVDGERTETERETERVDALFLFSFVVIKPIKSYL
jgi:hypothetical protein